MDGWLDNQKNAHHKVTPFKLQFNNWIGLANKLVLIESLTNRCTQIGIGGTLCSLAVNYLIGITYFEGKQEQNKISSRFYIRYLLLWLSFSVQQLSSFW